MMEERRQRVNGEAAEEEDALHLFVARIGLHAKEDMGSVQRGQAVAVRQNLMLVCATMLPSHRQLQWKYIQVLGKSGWCAYRLR